MDNFLLNEKVDKIEENLVKLFKNLSENELKLKLIHQSEPLHNLKYNTSTFALDEPFVNNLNSSSTMMPHLTSKNQNSNNHNLHYLSQD
jgi:hypothetical protein